MKTATALPLFVLFLAPLALAPLGACASDQNKQLKEATAQEAENMRQQSEAQINQTKKQQMQAIDSSKTNVQNLPDQAQERAKAQSAMLEERQKYQADAQARIQKVQARLDESRRKLQISGGRAPTAIHDELNETSRLSNALASDIDHLPEVSNDAWGAEKKRIDARLGEVESATDDVKTKADAAPK